MGGVLLGGLKLMTESLATGLAPEQLLHLPPILWKQLQAPWHLQLQMNLTLPPSHGWRWHNGVTGNRFGGKALLVPRVQSPLEATMPFLDSESFLQK